MGVQTIPSVGITIYQTSSTQIGLGLCEATARTTILRIAVRGLRLVLAVMPNGIAVSAPSRVGWGEMSFRNIHWILFAYAPVILFDSAKVFK